MPTYQQKLKPIAASTFASKLKPITPAVPTPYDRKANVTASNPTGFQKPTLSSLGGQIAGAFKGGIAQANQGAEQARSSGNPVNKLEGLLKFGSGVVAAASAPLAPVFAPLGGMIDTAGRGYATLKPVQQLANTKAGAITERVAEDFVNAGTIAGGALGGRAVVNNASAISSRLKPSPKPTPPPGTPPPGTTPPKAATKIVDKRVSELQKLEGNNAPVRRVIAKAQERGIDSKRLLAETDLLKGSVDSNGTIRTKTATQELNSFIKPYEDVISEALAREGVRLRLDVVADRLRRAIDESGLEADALEAAHTKLQSTVAGLGRRADPSGTISLSKIHDAKVSKYATVDYLNEGAKIADKAIARAFKELVESHTKSADAKALNAELARHYAVLDLLEKLDGKKVTGGRLGKYFAQTVGAVAGSHFGPLGSIVGAELGGRVRGGMLQSTFKGETRQPLQMSGAMIRAVEQNKMPPLGLPAPKEGTPSKAVYAPIPLRGRITDEPAYSSPNSFGNRK